METHDGFTLAELLVVTAITSLLISILIPNLLNARRVTMETNAQQLARHVATLAEIKRADNGHISISTNKANCTPILISAILTTIESCEFYQDNNGLAA